MTAIPPMETELANTHEINNTFANKKQLTTALVAASVLHEPVLPGFESLFDYASFSHNLAIGILKASVLQAKDLADRVSVHLLDTPCPQGASKLHQDLLEKVISIAPDIVGLSCYCWNIEALLDLAAKLHRQLPNTLILAGGPSAGPNARNLLTANNAIHAVARGEGEPVFLSLLRALLHGDSLETVIGLIWRDPNNNIRENSDPPPVDQATLPSPYRLGLLPAIPYGLLVETSRGCRYRCKFCSFMGSSRKLRYTPVDALEADLRWAAEHGVRGVSLADTAINFDTIRLRELAAAIARADPGHLLRFSYFIKPELLTREQASVLAAIPSAEVIVGVESFTAEARKTTGKPPLSPKDFVSQVQLLQHVGPVTCSFIMGLPGDTVAGLEHTLKWICDIDREHPNWFHVICLFWLAILPGSRLDAMRDSIGIRCTTHGIPYVLDSNEHDTDTLLRMARLSVEAHYSHPKLRVEQFHNDYLAQDAPAPDRGPPIERRIGDSRPCVLLYGDVDHNWLSFGLEPYNLPTAWLKAFVETDDDLRRSFRLELATEKEDFATLLAKLDPTWIVRSCLRRPDSSPDWLAHIECHSSTPSLVLVGARSEQEAQTWMQTATRATAATVGECEFALRWLLRGRHDAPGLVRRTEGCLAFTGPSEVVQELDDIPSPFQWQFIQRIGPTIAMQFGRRNPSRFWSSKRLHGDIRWAIGRHHSHIVWLDESLPSDQQQVSQWINAIKSADPDGKIQHSYRLDGSQSFDTLEALSQLPANSIVVTGHSRDPQWESEARQLGAKLGAVVKWEDTLSQLVAALQPLSRPATLPGWQLSSVDLCDDAVAAEFVWNGGPVVRIRLSSTERGVKASLEPSSQTRPPDKQLARLQQAVTFLVDRRRLGSRR